MFKHTNYIKEIFIKDRLRLLIFFVTARCNSRCKTCFYWKSLNKMDELTLKEIKLISEKMPTFPLLSLSGGEPFLREDLTAICQIFHTQNKVRAISIPTNCLTTDKIGRVTEEILQCCKGITLNINPSLDGIEKTHDSIRGIKGNFKKFLKTVEYLKKIKKTYPELKINVATVVFKDNLGQLEELVDFVKKLGVDSHNLEIIRGTPKQASFLDKNEFEKYRKIALKTDRYYISKEYKGFAKNYILAKKRVFYNLQKSFINGKCMPIRCLAGATAGVIEPNGDVRLCELLEPVGNLRETNHNFNEVWGSKRANLIRNQIRKSKCTCTHCIFLYQSIEHDLFTSLIKIPSSMALK